jgi:Fe2+-dicitrate sensor, membrane component
MVAQTKQIEPSRAVIEAAAAWQAHLADEDCAKEDRQAFQDWLDADPIHTLAFDRISAVTQQVSTRTPVERAALGMMFAGRRRHSALMLIALVGSATAIALWGAGEPSIRARIADQRTAVGEQHRAVLASGDGLVFDTDTAADIDERNRTIELWRGGVMAHVEKGAARPFVIRSPQGTARALGTQYSVRVEGKVTTVSVIESRVEACASTGNRSCVTLEAGQSARLDARGARRVGDIDPVSEMAWSDGLLVADDRPLSEVIDRLNRYRRDPIHYAPEDIQGLRVSGTFPLSDTERALTSLSAALPIAVEDGPDGTAVKRR